MNNDLIRFFTQRRIRLVTLANGKTQPRTHEHLYLAMFELTKNLHLL